MTRNIISAQEGELFVSSLPDDIKCYDHMYFTCAHFHPLNLSYSEKEHVSPMRQSEQEENMKNYNKKIEISRAIMENIDNSKSCCYSDIHIDGIESDELHFDDTLNLQPATNDNAQNWEIMDISWAMFS